MNHALYYPTIEFQNQDCLKKSLLVWDRIFRIVPDGYTPNDSTAVREAIATGAVVDLTLDDGERAQAANKFLDFYAQRISPNNCLVWPAGLDSKTFTRLNLEKIDAKLQPLFEQLSRRQTSDGFMEIPQELAGGYMFYLAKAVAQHRSCELITDSADCWTVGSFFASEGNFDEQVYAEKAEAYLCNLAVNDLLPDQLDHIPMDEVLRFVDDHRSERAEFQKELEALRVAITKCNSKLHARYIAEDLVKKFVKAKADYRKTIAPFSKREFCSIFSGAVATTMSFLSLPIATNGDPYDPIRLGLGLLFGAVSALATREMIPKEKSVASYLVAAEQLSGTPSVPLYRKFHEFIND